MSDDETSVKFMLMKLGIMQPYFFPYLGYWQLLKTVDRFVVLDDVNYINRGWINRNRILINAEPSYITIPLRKVSQNMRICDLLIHEESPWRNKILRSIEHAYRRAPFFDSVFPLLEIIISNPVENLADYLLWQLQKVSSLLDIETDIVPTSRLYKNEDLSGERRIIDINIKESADNYLNLESGQSLYNAEAFSDASIRLEFIKYNAVPYFQRYPGFVSHLSIIDVLMELGPEKAASKLAEHELIQSEHI